MDWYKILEDKKLLYIYFNIFVGAPLWGNMEGRSFPRVFERRDTFLYLGKFLLGI
jgi:hypothetical protein